MPVAFSTRREVTDLLNTDFSNFQLPLCLLGFPKDEVSEAEGVHGFEPSNKSKRFDFSPKISKPKCVFHTLLAF